MCVTPVAAADKPRLYPNSPSDDTPDYTLFEISRIYMRKGKDQPLNVYLLKGIDLFT
jgi:hypothetical protein